MNLTDGLLLILLMKMKKSELLEIMKAAQIKQTGSFGMENRFGEQIKNLNPRKFKPRKIEF